MKRGSFARCVDHVSRKGVDDPRAVCAASKRKAGEALRNPADLAAEAFEAFHGYPPDEDIVFDTVEHEHTTYAGIGELVSLVIVPEGQRKGIKLHSFDGAQLSMNELAMKRSFFEKKPLSQLFVVGGDQELSAGTLRQFGINTGNLHEQEVLGKCVDIVYYTTKTHLGRDGGEADYHHRLAEETAGKNVELRILKSPTATYHVVNKIIGLWGGVYEILPEGIAD